MENSEAFTITPGDHREFYDLIEREVLDDMMESIAGQGANSENEFDYKFNDIELILLAESLSMSHTQCVQSGEFIRAAIFRGMFKALVEQHPDLDEIIKEQRQAVQQEMIKKAMGSKGGGGANESF